MIMGILAVAVHVCVLVDKRVLSLMVLFQYFIFCVADFIRLGLIRHIVSFEFIDSSKIKKIYIK